MNNEIINQQTETPPYLSFKTFLNAVQSLTYNGFVPAKVDPSVLQKFSGGIQNQLIPALRFMQLTDENNCPTEILKEISKSDEENQKEILKNILTSIFPEQVKLLANGTSQQITDSFNYIKLQPSVKKKCIRFFIKAAEYSGFNVSPPIKSGLKGNVGRPKKSGTTKRIYKKKRKEDSDLDTGKKQKNEYSIDPNLKKHPITLGFDKIWFIEIDENFEKEDVIKFTKMIQLALLGDIE